MQRLLRLLRQLHMRTVHVPQLLPPGMSGRTTRQQLAVRNLLAKTPDFRSAQELHALLTEDGARIGLATVYRVLGRMADQGEVDVFVRPDGESTYRLCSTGHHHHLVCRTCGTTVEVAAPTVERWANQVAAAAGFTDVSHTVELTGLCQECGPGGRLTP